MKICLQVSWLVLIVAKLSRGRLKSILFCSVERVVKSSNGKILRRSLSTIARIVAYCTHHSQSASFPTCAQIKRKEELIMVDTLLEEGLKDGDLPHLCLDKTLLTNSGHK